MKNPIIININVKRKEDITDKFNENIISDELSKYIYEQCYGEKFNKKININIFYEFAMDETEKNVISNMIKTNFSMLLLEEKIESKLELFKELIVFIIGAIFILIAYFVDHEHVYLLSEIISIFGWVAIWEFAYNILFVDNKRRIKIKRMKQ